MEIERMGRARLEELLDETSDEEIVERIYDELERRDRDEDLRDWTEQDARAAQEERIAIWRNEY